MAWYNVDLGERGVKQIDTLFKKGQFVAREHPDRPYKEIVDVSREPPVAVLGYGSSMIALYFTAIGKLSDQDKKMIRGRLSRIPQLREELSNELEYIVSGPPPL
tara:strand:+ start:43 stop:354 length:312 start_codon:yes stop_codon:yes gene_type:complete